MSEHHKPGQGSTGPKTPEGREISSRNAITHGGRSEKFRFLPGEDENEYERLRSAWYHEFKPLSELESSLVEDICHRHWSFKRNQRNYERAEAKIMEQKPDICDWTPDDHRLLQLATRYRNAAERAFHSAKTYFENLRKNRIVEAVQVEQLRKIYCDNKDKGRSFPENIGVLDGNWIGPDNMPPEGWFTADMVMPEKPGPEQKPA